MPSLAEDKWGVTWGYLRGAPAWLASDGGRPGVIRFNGATDYLALQRGASDHEDITVAAWVKWDGGAAGQHLFEFGADASRLLWLTPNDGLNRLLLIAKNGAAEEQLSAPALATDVWQHVAVTLNGDTATLFVNGLSVASRLWPRAAHWSTATSASCSKSNSGVAAERESEKTMLQPAGMAKCVFMMGWENAGVGPVRRASFAEVRKKRAKP